MSSISYLVPKIKKNGAYPCAALLTGGPKDCVVTVRTLSAGTLLTFALDNGQVAQFGPSGRKAKPKGVRVEFTDARMKKVSAAAKKMGRKALCQKLNLCQSALDRYMQKPPSTIASSIAEAIDNLEV